MSASLNLTDRREAVVKVNMSMQSVLRELDKLIESSEALLKEVSQDESQ